MIAGRMRSGITEALAVSGFVPCNRKTSLISCETSPVNAVIKGSYPNPLIHTTSKWMQQVQMHSSGRQPTAMSSTPGVIEIEGLRKHIDVGNSPKK